MCKQAPSKIARHQAINDVIARAITTAGVPVSKEPVGLVRIDGKRPDGLTLIPWQDGKPLTWDVTVVSTLADSYLHSTSHSAGSAAETASIRKESKYSSLPPEYWFQPVAVETLGPLNASAVNFLSVVGRRLTSLSGDPIGGGKGQWLGGTMASAEHEPITGVWGQSPERDPGAEPLVRESGGRSPLKLKAFWSLDVQRSRQI